MKYSLVSGVSPKEVSFGADSFKLNNELSGFDVKVKFGTSGAKGDFYTGMFTQLFLYSTTRTVVESDFQLRNSGNNKYQGAYHINLPELSGGKRQIRLN